MDTAAEVRLKNISKQSEVNALLELECVLQWLQVNFVLWQQVWLGVNAGTVRISLCLSWLQMLPVLHPCGWKVICCFAPSYSLLSILEFAPLLLFIVYFPFWLLSNSLFYGFWVLCDKTVQIDHVLFDDTACPCWCDFFGSTQVDYLRSGQQVSAACKATLSIALNVWTTLCLYMGICPL